MIGKTVSHYRITRQLGAGGMGIVYEAEDLNLQRKVALKFLAPELSRDPAAKHRFRNEALAASSLEHGSICTIHEIDETPDGQLFLVMPSYEGETLRDRIDRGPLPIADAVQIVTQVARGLARAHDRDLVHRDIKPENIFLTHDDGIRILDFGLAKLAGATRLTREGTTMGTPGYLSPEQALGHEAEAPADVWSVGVILHEMLTGRPLYSGDHYQAVLYAIQNVDPESASQTRSEIPADLQKTIDRCLMKEPSDRFQDAVELLAALEGAERPTGPNAPSLPILMMAIVVLTAVVILAWQQPWKRSPTEGGVSRGINWILVAELDGPDDDPGLAIAARELIIAGLEQSNFITPVSRAALKRGLKLAGLPDSTIVSGQTARQLADRVGAGAYVTGRIDRLPGAYAFILRVWNTETDDLIASLQDRAEGEGDFIPVLDGLGGRLREILGESIEAVQATHQPLEVITPSYQAYRSLVRATTFQREGDNYAALLEARHALKLDPDFASAWYLMAVCYGNTSRRDSTRWALEMAMARPNRMTESQLRSIEVWYQGFVNHDLGGALLSGQLLVELDPSSGNYNFLGMIYHQSGEFGKAIDEFARAAETSAFVPSYAVMANLTLDLINVGRFAEAEVRFKELPEEWRQHRTLDLLQAKGDWEGVGELALRFRDDPEISGSVWLLSSATLASLEVVRGSVESSVSKFQECRNESFGTYIPVLEYAQDRLYLASGRIPSLLPEPVLPDTTMLGLVMAGLRAVSLGELNVADENLMAARKRSDPEQRKFAPDLAYFEALIAGARKDWESVLPLLESLTVRGRLPVFVGKVPIRRLVAEAHENLGNLEEASEAYAAVIDPTEVTDFGAQLELFLWGIEYPFALHRLAGLLDQLGKTEEARERYQEFLELFREPDPEFEHLVAEANVALTNLSQK